MLVIGMIINALIGFLITAVVIVLVIVEPANALMAMMKKAEAAAPPPATPENVQLLTEIRDLLKTKEKPPGSTGESQGHPRDDFHAGILLHDRARSIFLALNLASAGICRLRTRAFIHISS